MLERNPQRRRRHPLLIGPPMMILPQSGTLWKLSRPDQIEAAKAASAGCGRIAVIPAQSRSDAPDLLQGALARVCALRILTSQTAIIVLAGLKRIVVTDSIVVPDGFHWGTVQPLSDRFSQEQIVDPRDLKDQLIAAVCAVIPEPRRTAFERDVDDPELSLSALGDVIGDAFALSPRERDDLLRETDVDSRTRLLLELLAGIRGTVGGPLLRSDHLFHKN